MNKKYRVLCDWWGYSRGVATFVVEASSSEEAERIALYGGGELQSRHINRDDTESRVDHVEEITNDQDQT